MELVAAIVVALESRSAPVRPRRMRFDRFTRFSISLVFFSNQVSAAFKDACSSLKDEHASFRAFKEVVAGVSAAFKAAASNVQFPRNHVGVSK